jgi:putative addiction module component (TIGR02574 family)
MAITPSDYRHLSVEERLELVSAIWNSIAADAQANPALLPLSDEERAELDRRVAEDDADPGAAIPWDEALAQIRQEVEAKRVRRG